MKNLYKNLSKWNQLFFIVGIAFLSLSLFGALSTLLIRFGFGLQLSEITDLKDIHDVNTINALKLVQLINSVALFIIPVFAFAYITQNKTLQYLNLNKSPKITSLVLVFLLMFLLFPFVNWMALINSNMHLPDFLSGLEHWMLVKEERADNLSRMMLNAQTFGQFMVNLIIIAIIPAIGEELLFRGVLQRLFSGITKNIHWGIIIAAFVFSAAHLQFFGFLQRFFFGLLFGYLYVMSRSLWVTIFAHFIVNGTVVLIYFLIQNDKTIDSASNFGSENYLLILGSIVISTILFLLFANFNKEKGKKIYLGY